MKNQTVFAKVKKIFKYPFNWDFIDRQQKALKLLETLYEAYYGELQIKFDEEKAVTCQEVIALRNKLNKCWNLHDVTLTLSKNINMVLWGNKINIDIFDLKTKWFLWQKIILFADFIEVPKAKTAAKRQLNILREISIIFDLGK